MSGLDLRNRLALVLSEFRPTGPELSPDYYFETRHVEVARKRLPLPFAVFMAFDNVDGYTWSRGIEKSRWEIPFYFRNVLFLVAHRKFGLDIRCSKSA